MLITPRQANDARAALQKHGLSEQDFEISTSENEFHIRILKTRFYFRFARRTRPKGESLDSFFGVVDAISTATQPFSYEHFPDLLHNPARLMPVTPLIVSKWEDAADPLNRWLAWIEREYGPFEAPKLLGESSASKAQVSPLAHLHPFVCFTAESRFASAHYSDAISAACTALDKAVAAKAQRSDLNGKQLMDVAFTPRNPLLRLSPNDNEQMGFMLLYQGVVQAIRNHYAHNLTEVPAARALEWLGFISALFFKLDEATASPPSL